MIMTHPLLLTIMVKFANISFLIRKDKANETKFRFSSGNHK